MNCNPMQSSVKQVFALLLILFTTFTTSVFAIPGDEHWSRDFYRQGICGQINSLLTYNDLLVMGGSISAAGQLPVQNIATWNGWHWGTLGDGINGEITTLLEFNGQLIASGEFTQAGSTPAANIARWDGSTWQALSAGSNGPITNLFVFEGQLIALGDFSHSLGADGAHIACWDGSNWSALGSGPDLEEQEDLYAVTILEENLVVAGDTNWFPLAGPKVWDGTEWSSPYPFPGNQPDAWYPDFGHISTLHVFEGELVAGGHFRYYDEETEDYFSAICRWDGSSWVGVGSGLFAPTPIESDISDVMTLLEYEGNLVAGGVFWEGIPAVSASGIIQWDGTTWQTMDTGLFGFQGWETGFVKDMINWNGSLLVGGSFDLAGDLPHREVHNLTLWQNNQWQPLGPVGLGLNGRVNATLEFGGQVVSAGIWRNIDGTMGHLAGLGAEGWEVLGDDPEGEVKALVLWADQLVIGGAFSEVGDQPALHVAAFDGTNWVALGNGIADEVQALAVYEGELYAGPYRWDGAAWINEIQTNGPIHSLQVWDGDLFAGGTFDQAGDVDAAGIAGWNGEECFSLGAGVTHPNGNPMSVYTMTTYGNELIAGGNFYLAGDDWVFHLARWNGTEWSAVSDSLGSAGSQYGIYSLTSHEDHLFAGGRFLHQGMELNGLGRWDGSSWHALGSGFRGENIYSLMVMEDGLLVGGEFQTAGGMPAFSLGLWADPEVFVDPAGVFDQMPASAMSLNVYPNPFNPRTEITFSIAQSGPVDLAIYDLRGRQVAVLEQRNMSAGNHVVYWDGVDQWGRALPSGAYFVRLGIDAGVEVGKVMLVR